MPRNVPYMPGAYNYWAGNQFMIPPLGQYARPVYADALAPLASNDPTLAAAMPQAVDPRIADHAMAGRGAGESMGAVSGGQQPTREANSLSDWAGSAMRGVSMMTPGVGFGMNMVDMARRGEPFNGYSFNLRDLIPGVGVYDTLRGLASDAGIGIGTGGAQLGSSLSVQDPVALDMPGFGDTVGAAPTPADLSVQNDTSDAMYAGGGKVKALLGPNPPGPDDGLAFLDAGEHVIRASSARKHRGLLEAINKDAPKKKLRGLLR